MMLSIIESKPEVDCVNDTPGVYKISMVRMSNQRTDELANVRVYKRTESKGFGV